MKEGSPILVSRLIEAESIDVLRPLWEKLRGYHAPWLERFPGEQPPYNFTPRKAGLLAKAAQGHLRIELVRGTGDPTDIAYCVTTVTADGRGEVDSMFVDESFRGHGIGTELLRRALAWCDAVGAVSKSVSVAYENREALALYQRFGFHPRVLQLQQHLPGPKG